MYKVYTVNTCKTVMNFYDVKFTQKCKVFLIGRTFYAHFDRILSIHEFTRSHACFEFSLSTDHREMFTFFHVF